MFFRRLRRLTVFFLGKEEEQLVHRLGLRNIALRDSNHYISNSNDRQQFTTLMHKYYLL